MPPGLGFVAQGMYIVVSRVYNLPGRSHDSGSALKAH